MNPQQRANRRGYAALLAQSLDNLTGSGGPLQVDHIPTPGCYDGIVPPRCDLHTLTNVIFGPSGGLMVVAIEWPIARGDRHYAKTQLNMGNAWARLTSGDQVDNLQRAITCYEEALRFWTADVAPLDYAAVQNNLGNAYRNLQWVDRDANLRRAISCYGEALRFWTSETAPLEYAAAQHGLGNAYSDLSDADAAADNAHRAINCYREALRFRTAEVAPLDYAATQSCLGSTWATLPAGVRSNNLRRAIGCYQDALRFCTAEAAPLDYADTQNNLGWAYQELAVATESANLEPAITCFREALRFRTLDAAPSAHRVTARNLGDLHFGARAWLDAETAYASALAAEEALYLVAATESAQHTVLVTTPNLVAHDAYCLARLGGLSQAVVRLELGRTRGLADTLALTHAAIDGATPNDRHAFSAARERVRALDVEARNAGTANTSLSPRGSAQERSFVELSDDLRAARQALVEVADRIRTYVPEFMPVAPDFATIAAAASDPLVYLITTSQGSLALIVLPGATMLRAERAVWLDAFTSEDLDKILMERDADAKISGYLPAQVVGDAKMLGTALDRLLPLLHERLVGPLAARLAELGYARCTLIASGRLALLPLHAVALQALRVTYAPSVRVLRTARNAAAERAGRSLAFVGIGNPLPNPRPLVFARAEVDAIAALVPLPARQVLCEQQATRRDLLSRLAGATHLHFACHGTFDMEEPLRSALFLAGPPCQHMVRPVESRK